MKLRTIGIATATVALAGGVPARAQWLTQEFALQPGYNSVFLEVDPSPERADDLFAGLPIEAVWTPVPKRVVEGPPDCADPDDPTCTPPETSRWWVWLPPDDPAAVVRTLRLIRGGQVYLIKATEAATLTVTGRPSSTVLAWRGGFNLAGFHVVDDPGAAPTFATYLAGSAAHASPAVFGIQADGAPVAVADPTTTRITPGRGFWVRSNGDTEYGGPFEIDKGSLRGLDFWNDLSEQYVRLRNRTSAARDVTIAYVSSAAVPPIPADLPTSVGDVPLEYLTYQSGQLQDAFEWMDLGSQTSALGAASQASARQTVRVAVRRAGLAPATVDSTGAGSLYQGLLRVTDNQGFERWLPVSAEVAAGVGGSGAVAGMGSPRPGLYFGNVTVDHVSWITAGAPVWTNNDPTEPTIEDNPDKDTSTLRPAPAEFSFPVLIHLAESGEYKFLTEVTLLFAPGDADAGIPGRYVLATPACDPAVCDALTAGSLQDGRPFARRIATAAFSFEGDLPLSGAFSSSLSGQTVLPADHPLNPFRHRRHPDHDCSAAGECFEVSRAFTFEFASEPPEGLDRPEWGDSLLAGTYTETLHGLHKDPIGVSGRFDLQRIANVPALNAN